MFCHWLKVLRHWLLLYFPVVLPLNTTLTVGLDSGAWCWSSRPMHSQRATQMNWSWGTPSCSQRSGRSARRVFVVVEDDHGIPVEFQSRMVAQIPSIYRGGGDRRSWPHGHALAARGAGWVPHQNCQQLKQRLIKIGCFAFLVCCRTFDMDSKYHYKALYLYEYTNTMTEFTWNCFKSVGSRNIPAANVAHEQTWILDVLQKIY